MKQVGFKSGVKERGVRDKQSGKGNEEKVMGEARGESAIAELVPE